MTGEVRNIGSGKQTTLKEIVDIAIDLTGTSTEAKWGTMEKKSWDRNIWQADISKAASILKWLPKTSLEKGLTKTLKWLEKSDQLFQK